jgi:MoaA/NifB/PqqE/SkfB family radical SAM enzyme
MNFIKKLFYKLPNFLKAFVLWLLPPKYMTFEVTNVCNLKCPLCPTVKVKEKRFAAFSDFKKVINEVNVETVSFYLLGEPLLNKDLFKMVKYAEDKNVKTFFSTNDMLLDKHIDDIFDSGLSKIQVTLDGLTKEDHESYRVNSDFDKCLENIEKLCSERKRRNSKKPVIKMQTLLFKHNLDKKEGFIKLAKKLGIDVLQFKMITLGPDEKNKEKLKEKFKPEQFDREKKTLYKNMPVCPLIIKNAFVLSSGELVLCCFDPYGEASLGNVFEKPFYSVWYSYKRFSYLKKALDGKLDICKKCDGALNSVEGIVLNEKKR